MQSIVHDVLLCCNIVRTCRRAVLKASELAYLFTTQSMAQNIRRIVRGLVNNEEERCGMKRSWINLRFFHGIWLESLRKTKKARPNSRSPGRIRTRQLPDMKQEC